MAKSCLGMPKLHNIRSSSIYGLCVWFAPERVKKPTPLRNGSRNGPFSGTFSPINVPSCRQFDIDENETKCVNYKYCLVDAPGVSHSCTDQESQVQTSFTDTLNRVYQKGTPNPVAQLFWCGTFDCSGKVMPWHVQTRQYSQFIGVWFVCLICPWAGQDAPRTSKTGPEMKFFR